MWNTIEKSGRRGVRRRQRQEDKRGGGEAGKKVKEKKEEQWKGKEERRRRNRTLRGQGTQWRKVSTSTCSHLNSKIF